MCGICGLISQDGLNVEASKLFEKVMNNIESRGRDAFGYFSYPKNGIYKVDSSVSDFLTKKKIWTDIKRERVVLGHTRATTKGTEKTNHNNHPFETKDFVLAHNGVIWNEENLRKSQKIENEIETDSYIIIALIQKFYLETKNVVEAIKKTTALIRGSYACWLFHRKSGEVFLFRKTNPIMLTYIRDWGSIVFASDMDFYKKEVTSCKFEQELNFFTTLFNTRKLKENIIYRIKEDLNFSLYKFKSADEYSYYNRDNDKDDEWDEDFKRGSRCNKEKKESRSSKWGDNGFKGKCQNAYMNDLLDFIEDKSLSYSISYQRKKVEIEIPEFLIECLGKFGYTASKNGCITVCLKNTSRFEESYEKALNEVLKDSKEVKLKGGAC